MPVRKANAEWKGNLKEGTGTLRAESGAVDGAYSYPSRFESGRGTNPEELLGAAHAGCFSMSLANMLSQAGYEVESVATEARVHLGQKDGASAVTKIELVTEATVPGIDEAEFREHAEAAKKGCPISKALAATDVTLEATLR